MPRPRDIVRDRPRILFVGINPGATSGRVGHHFAGPANPFWQLLHVAGLVPTLLRADEDARLIEYGYALVNLCTRPTQTAADLKRNELKRGAKRLARIAAELKPQRVALVGVTLFPIVFGSAAALAEPGPGEKTPTLADAKVFVLPNPSGLNASFPTFDAKLPWFVALRKLVDVQWTSRSVR